MLPAKMIVKTSAGIAWLTAEITVPALLCVEAIIYTLSPVIVDTELILNMIAVGSDPESVVPAVTIRRECIRVAECAAELYHTIGNSGAVNATKFGGDLYMIG